MTKVHRFNFRHSFLAVLFGVAAASLGSVAHVQAATITGSTNATVVWVSVPVAPPRGDFTMVNHEKSFIPPLLVIPTGSTVRFPNEDPFYHSIYSNSPTDSFDIGYYDTGPGKVVTFAKAGVVDVRCHIHATMHATIIVVDGPSVQAQSGRYSLVEVPAGRHTLHWWDANHGERTIEISVPNATSTVKLDLGNV